MLRRHGPTAVIASASEAIHFTAEPVLRMDCFVASAFARRRASADKRAPVRKRFAFVAGNDAVKVVIHFKHQIHVRLLAAGDARGLRFVVPQTGGCRE
jgi:hypothetical protein